MCVWVLFCLFCAHLEIHVSVFSILTFDHLTLLPEWVCVCVFHRSLQIYLWLYLLRINKIIDFCFDRSSFRPPTIFYFICCFLVHKYTVHFLLRTLGWNYGRVSTLYFSDLFLLLFSFIPRSHYALFFVCVFPFFFRRLFVILAINIYFFKKGFKPTHLTSMHCIEIINDN